MPLNKSLLATMLFDSVRDGVMIADRGGNIVQVNAAFSLLTGYSSDESVGHDWISLLESTTNPNSDDSLEDIAGALAEQSRWQGDLWCRNKNGNAQLLSFRLLLVSGDDEYLLFQMHEAGDDGLDEDPDDGQTIDLAHYDSLTGLTNRSLFLDRLGSAILRAKRSDGKLTVFFLDLDNFKNVNDSLGHEYGDELLQEAARRLEASVRGVDTVARLGGDEFTVLLEDLSREEDISTIARKLIKSLSVPYLLRGEDVYITVSLGITYFPTDGDDAKAMLRNADMAMYHAKKLGKNNYQIFDPAMNERAVKRVEMEKRLRKAVANDELVAYFQPKVDLTTNRMAGMEALMRWQGEDGKLIPPDDFIPLAEETGLIIGLDEWMLDSVCDFISEMREENIHDFAVSVNVSVNLSAIVLERKDLVETITRSVERLGLSHSKVELEVTESSVIRNVDLAIETIGRLRQAGFSVSMDDFGTGYSSLSYLTKLPINVLKIDRAFVTDLPVNKNARSVARAIVSMAHEMDMKVIAEGVETKEQLSFLREIGCNEIQGYLYSPPLCKEKMKDLLREQRVLDV